MATALAVDAIRGFLSAPAAWAVHVVERVASTNTVALEWAAAGAPAGTALLAESQTAGRGRGGRAWRTPDGTSLALSVILRPTIAPDRLPWIGIAAAVATVEAILDVAGVACRVKWPNDILIGARKVAGILAERRAEAGGTETPAVVIGVGVNVNNRAAALPADVRDAAISLLDATGRATDRNRLAAALLDRLAWRVGELGDGRDELARRWTAASATLGQHLAVTTPGGLIEGADEGLDPSGSLLLRQPDGRRVAVHSGEVLLCRTASPPLL